MNQINEARVEAYLEIFERVKHETGSESAALGVLQEVAKDQRTEKIREGRKMTNEEPATQKQRFLLVSRGVNIPQGLTKKEASTLIDDVLSRGIPTTTP